MNSRISFFKFSLSILVVMSMMISCELIDILMPKTIYDVRIGMTQSEVDAILSSGSLVGQSSSSGGQTCSTYRYRDSEKYYLLTFCDGKLDSWISDGYIED